MTSRLFGWPLVLGSFGLILGLIVGQAAVSILDVALLSGPKGPAVGGVIGVLLGAGREYNV